MIAILLVEASATARGEMAGALERAGYRVNACASLGEARTTLRTQPIGLAVIGLALGDGDGITLLEQIRHDQLLGAMPVILLASFDEVSARISGLGMAAANCLPRPADPTLMLARVRDLVGAAASPREVGGTAFATRRVLAADDDADYLALLAVGMRKRGYEVVTVPTCEEAMARVATERFDMILLDRHMDGLDGVGACKLLKNNPETRAIPLMLMTAAEGREAVIEGLGAGADDFVAKKSGLDVLAARVQVQLRRKQGEDEQRRTRDQLLRSELAASEARAAAEIAETRAQLADDLAQTNRELAQTNRELEAFSYSVSHDLRAPLRTISAFTHALAEDLEGHLGDAARDHLRRVLAASARMSDLIDALLELARIHQVPVGRYRVDLSTLAAATLEELQRRDGERAVELIIAPELVVSADGRLMRVLLDNLLGNAWKFTVRTVGARIELGVEEESGESVFFVRDNGAGFAMEHAELLFTPFHRLHTEAEYKGTGIGLATVRRIVERHGGRIWARGAVGAGATVSFTIPPERRVD